MIKSVILLFKSLFLLQPINQLFAPILFVVVGLSLNFSGCGLEFSISFVDGRFGHMPEHDELK